VAVAVAAIAAIAAAAIAEIAEIAEIAASRAGLWCRAVSKQSIQLPIPRFSATLPSQRPMVSSDREMARGTCGPLVDADGVMPTARYRGPPMTLANMRAQGVRIVAADEVIE
jgi:hypothetical protein